jgi:uncharacterized alkaline shock family protein YloU
VIARGRAFHGLLKTQIRNSIEKRNKLNEHDVSMNAIATIHIFFFKQKTGIKKSAKFQRLFRGQLQGKGKEKGFEVTKGYKTFLTCLPMRIT